MSCEAYQVKLQVNVSDDIRCLYDKLGKVKELFNLEKAQCKPSVCSAMPPVVCDEECDEILSVEFDKCDCNKAIFMLKVWIEKKDVSNECQNDCPIFIDVGPLAKAKYSITMGGHGLMQNYRNHIATFIVYALGDDVISSGVVNDCLSYEIFRCDCSAPLARCDEPSAQVSACDANCFRVILPLTKDLLCLVPDFKVGGMLANEIISQAVSTKVRIVGYPMNNCPSIAIPALLTFDKLNCTACFDVCLADVDSLTEGFEYLYKCSARCNKACDCEQYSLANKTFEEMTRFRKFDLMGVSKCTETILFSFQVCHGPICGDVLRTYRINANAEYCYEFRHLETA
jgi:hypothetical protein